MNIKVLIGLILLAVSTSSIASANINDFLIKNQMVHELTQNKSFMRCINQKLENLDISGKHAIVLRQVNAGSDLSIVQSLSSSLIQSFIKVRQNVADKVHLYDAADFTALHQKEYDVIRIITTTLSGFESGGELPGRGVELHSKYLSFGSGLDFEHKLLSVDFQVSTETARILDGFSLGSVFDSIDRSKNAVFGGSSFSIVFAHESYNSPSRVLAEKLLLTHAAVKLLESILAVKFNCVYKSSSNLNRANVGNAQALISRTFAPMEVIEVSASLPSKFKNKRFYFPRSDSRTFKCLRLKCQIKFRGPVNNEIAAYVEEAMLTALPVENDVEVNCDIDRGKLKCLATGNIKGFSKRKMKRYLYGS